ncbi:DUF362 domain-containing protein [Candidatus Woesearchaeota archaeon]|nr:DUF362 domain-containing protein [Candidatus Woesearchaeota archaeon]
MASEIIITKITREFKHELFMKIKKAMELAEWKKHVSSGKIFIKPDYMSSQVVPGLCTSPWVLESVIRVVRQAMPYAKITVGDADPSCQGQLEKSFRDWGIDRLCSEQGVGLLNLSRQPAVKLDLKGRRVHELHMPRVIAEADSIISVPVVKTHKLTGMACALKNQESCIGRISGLFHNCYGLMDDIFIAEINKAVKVDFVVADATVCLEGNGPRAGKPRVMNMIIASSDRVALDTAVSEMMGLDPKKIGHIIESEKIGIGTRDYLTKGATLPKARFLPAKVSKPVACVDVLMQKIQKIPLISYLLLKAKMSRITAWLVSRCSICNPFCWYNLKGKRYARDIVDHYPLYAEEFRDIIGK